MLLAWEMLSPHSFKSGGAHGGGNAQERDGEGKKKVVLREILIQYAHGAGGEVAFPLHHLQPPFSLLFLISHCLYPNLCSSVTSLPESPFLFCRRPAHSRVGKKKGWWSRRAVGGWGLVVIEGSDSQHPPPPHRLVEGSNSFKFRQGGRIKKNLNSSSNSARHLCALASLRLFSCRITCIFPQPSPPPPARSVTLSSPFTAGLGCSFRRQTHSVSLLLLAAEGTAREKGENGEKERDGEEEEEEE